MQTSREISSTAQKFLEIHDIVNDLLILKDGSTALIITVSAMNFGLLAEEEQDAIIYSYASLLNSLNYPIQIVIKSQTKDVTSYLHLLDNELEVATSQVKREWIKKYRSFVANLIRERNVLDKKFYVVIPATALEMGLLPPSTVIPGVQQPDLSTVEKSVILEKAREILEPKRDHLMSQFGRIGLIARQLTTQEIIQLFYLSYNPEAAEGQQITDTNSYTTPLVRASVIRGGNMADLNQTTTGPNLVAPATSPAAMSTTSNVAPAVDQSMSTQTPDLTGPTMPDATSQMSAPPAASTPAAPAPTMTATPAMTAPSPVATNIPTMPTTQVPLSTTPSVSPAVTSTPAMPVATPVTPATASNQTQPQMSQANVGAVTMPNIKPVNTLNSTASENVNISDLQNEINSAAQEVVPESPNIKSDLPSPSLPQTTEVSEVMTNKDQTSTT